MCIIFKVGILKGLLISISIVNFSRLRHYMFVLTVEVLYNFMYINSNSCFHKLFVITCLHKQNAAKETDFSPILFS